MLCDKLLRVPEQLRTDMIMYPSYADQRCFQGRGTRGNGLSMHTRCDGRTLAGLRQRDGQVERERGEAHGGGEREGDAEPHDAAHQVARVRRGGARGDGGLPVALRGWWTPGWLVVVGSTHSQVSGHYKPLICRFSEQCGAKCGPGVEKWFHLLRAMHMAGLCTHHTALTWSTKTVPKLPMMLMMPKTKPPLENMVRLRMHRGGKQSNRLP